MIRFFLFLINSAFLLFIISACEHDPELPPNSLLGADSLVCFNNQVLPIISSNCGMSGCHDGSEEFALNSYEDILRKVRPGDPNGSELYKAVVPNKFTNKVFMPPSSKTALNNAQITLIELWILQGAKSNCQK